MIDVSDSLRNATRPAPAEPSEPVGGDVFPEHHFDLRISWGVSIRSERPRTF